jgi:predicted dehydrogenase
MVVSGFVGEMTRVTLVRTNWFRSAAYYRSSPWRATWEGEGGGILVNQAPHDLDLLAWTVGLPSEVCAEINTLSHDIEVEDDVTAILKWPNGATGTLHVTTNESPGRDFLEIAGTRGALLLEHGKLQATQLAVDAREFSETTQEKIADPPIRSITATTLFDQEDRHLAMSRNMIAAIRRGVPLICSGEDALKEVEFANALLISGVKGKRVRAPADRQEFDDTLHKLVELKSLTKAKTFYGNASPPPAQGS